MKNLMLTFGPYPEPWTRHVLMAGYGDIHEQIMEWYWETCYFPW